MCHVWESAGQGSSAKSATSDRRRPKNDKSEAAEQLRCGKVAEHFCDGKQVILFLDAMASMAWHGTPNND